MSDGPTILKTARDEEVDLMALVSALNDEMKSVEFLPAEAGVIDTMNEKDLGSLDMDELMASVSYIHTITSQVAETATAILSLVRLRLEGGNS